MGKAFIGNFKGPKGDKGDQGPQGIQGPAGPTGPTGTIDANVPLEFTEAETLDNIESEESILTILGKIKKIMGSLLIGAGSTLLGQNLTAARALITNANGKIGVSTITAAEIGYLAGLTKNAQTQFNELNANIANLLSDAAITTIPVTPNTAYNTGFTVKQIGKLVVINFQTDWAQWDNSEGILIGWIGKQPIAYVSREVVFANGVGQVFGVGNIYITNTQILVQTPTDWVNGAYAHISGTIAFYV